VILQQLQIIRTVWMPIIKRNNKKIWFTGKWKREGEKKVFFSSSCSIFLLLKKIRMKKKNEFFFFLSFLDNWSFLFAIYCAEVMSRLIDYFVVTILYC
jgi:hypothetical protein